MNEKEKDNLFQQLILNAATTDGLGVHFTVYDKMYQLKDLIMIFIKDKTLSFKYCSKFNKEVNLKLLNNFIDDKDMLLKLANKKLSKYMYIEIINYHYEDISYIIDFIEIAIKNNHYIDVNFFKELNVNAKAKKNLNAAITMIVLT